MQQHQPMRASTYITSENVAQLASRLAANDGSLSGTINAALAAYWRILAQCRTGLRRRFDNTELAVIVKYHNEGDKAAPLATRVYNACMADLHSPDIDISSLYNRLDMLSEIETIALADAIARWDGADINQLLR